ncbi:oxygen-insensitive NAD(P)H nitroreductase / dihydropteridine reductase [Geobacillus phage GR1]|nr:oxygen-insensitive NAD(P)H nitroreductase / dihydropteridine reductase [Geobacillus phage GR1]
MKEIILNRKNTTSFDPNFKIPREDLEEILTLAGKSPSAWNLQHWKFFVFESKESKEQLLPIAYYQKQIVDSSVVVAVLGDIEADLNFDEVYNPLVEKGYINDFVKMKLKKQVERAHEEFHDALEHAFVNAPLAAMTLIYAAESKGYNTGIIGGFDREQFEDTFNVPENLVPIMLIPIGKRTAEPYYSERFSLEKTTFWF